MGYLNLTPEKDLNGLYIPTSSFRPSPLGFRINRIQLLSRETEPEKKKQNKFIYEKCSSTHFAVMFVYLIEMLDIRQEKLIENSLKHLEFQTKRIVFGWSTLRWLGVG